MKNVLELANEMNNKAILKEKKNAIKLQNALKGNIINFILQLTRLKYKITTYLAIERNF